MDTSDRYPIQRLWKRESERDYVGVDVVGPDGMVVIDVYEYTPRAATTSCTSPPVSGTLSCRL